MLMLLPTLLLALATTDSLPLPADHVVNPDFDANTSFWQFHPTQGANLEWDATHGSPGLGSAHIRNSWNHASFDFFSQCVTLPPGGFEVDARVASQLQLPNRCEIRVDVVDQPDCNISAHVLVEVKAHNSLNDGSFETVAVTGVAPLGSGAAAIFIGHVRDGAAAIAPSDCWFDHVGFAGDPVFAGSFEP
jgi:hypothetical protein